MNEKRRFQRFPLNLAASYSAEPNKELYPCSIIDISRTGTRLLLNTEEKIEVGSLLKVEISPPDGGIPIKCIVSIVWIAQMQDENKKYYLCGGTFELIKNEDKWRLLNTAYDVWKDREAKSCLT